MIYASRPYFPPTKACHVRRTSLGSIGSFPLFNSLSKDVIELVGVVDQCYPNTTFRVRVTSDEAKDHTLLCSLAGRMRTHKVRILPGDKVKVEMTPYDLQKGRIVYRFTATSALQPGSPPPPPRT